MNRLIIIGNGFDLAHGLPTRYEDFVVDYFLNALDGAFDSKTYSDGVLKITRQYAIDDKLFDLLKDKIKSEHGTIPKLLCKQPVTVAIGGGLSQEVNDKFEFKINNTFLETLLKSSPKEWADIEQFYYDTLVKVAKKEIEPNRRDHWYKGDLTDLNLGFKFLKERFENYLREVVGSAPPKLNEEIFKIWTGNFRTSSAFEDETNTPLQAPEKLIFLNFNYTDTVSKYRQVINTKFDLKFEPIEIQIHGKVGDKTNPIIFGFGDEMDDNYKLLEKINNNRYLDYMKSFGYFKTNNYRLLHKSIHAAPFEVFIMGHSCGLSDRVMLNMIFEHSNCQSIKIFYHNDKNGHNNYLDLTQNISRHFNNKGSQRLKVRSELELAPLPQWGN